ncbi:DNA polymerase III subunit delta, partial [Enterococcus hirae]
MLYNEGTVNDEQLAACLALQANFDVFQLVDTCLLQNTSKSLTILEQLKSQGVEPSLVLWAFTKEIRLLSLMSFAIEQGS